MPFALDSDPSQSEISEAINYLLANFVASLATDPNTGLITGPSGIVVAYLYKYLAIKYADNIDGSLNFSNSPTNREYYGVRNTNETTESTNPADYIWYKVSGGFGTTKFLFYQTSGGRQINFYVGTSAPDATYIQDGGTAIDLDVITTTTAYSTAAPTIYQWTASSTPPARPTTTSTYTWATGNYTAPSGWTTSITVDTTAGHYLWAITIPLVVSSGTVTSTLDWTNTSYAIYVASSNGSAGATGSNGLSALTAYKTQSQSSAAPSTPSNTSGPTAPSGWSLTAPSVTVGDVLWYSFGQYNSSSGTINGVPAGQTQWGTPTAASIFQDIRSDNWNGSNPPSTSTPSTWGTQGYYISRSSGSMFLNDVYGRGKAIFNGVFTSTTTDTTAIEANASYGAKYGVVGYSINTGAFGAGVFGQAKSSAAVGVFGDGGSGGSGVRGDTGGSAVYGGRFANYGSGAAIYIEGGTLNFQGVQIQPPPASSSYVLKGDGNWYTGGSGTVTSVGLSVPSVFSVSGSPVTGSGTLSFSATSSTGILFNNGGTLSWTQGVLTAAQTNSGAAYPSGGILNMYGSTSTGVAGVYVGTSGSSNTVTWTVQSSSPSDERLKEDIADVDLGLDFVNKLRPVSYRLKADPKHQLGYGFIAQEVAKLGVEGTSLVYNEPEWVVGDQKGFNVVHYPSYIAVLVKAIQELTEKVEVLERKLNAS